MPAVKLREFARLGRAGGARASGCAEPREKEILALVADGQSNKEIATVLAVAENTVKHCVKKILEKLHLENRVQAAVFALSQDVPIIPSGAVPVVNGQNGHAKSR
jgi:DNA-binding NarL/FixJ family response regulator